MARAMEWACVRSAEQGGNFLIVNAGSNEWNYQVKDLAFAVRDVIENVEVVINQSAPPDKRSYRVDFSKFQELAPGYKPRETLVSTVSEMISNLNKVKFAHFEIYQSPFIRLKVLHELIQSGKINQQLSWIDN
jgi:nucleoside-diphosphate-sugar epimerase